MPLSQIEKSNLQTAVSALAADVQALQVDPDTDPLQAQLDQAIAERDSARAERDAALATIAAVKVKMTELAADDAAEDAKRAEISTLLG